MSCRTKPRGPEARSEKRADGARPEFYLLKCSCSHVAKSVFLNR